MRKVEEIHDENNFRRRLRRCRKCCTHAHTMWSSILCALKKKCYKYQVLSLCTFILSYAATAAVILFFFILFNSVVHTYTFPILFFPSHSVLIKLDSIIAGIQSLIHPKIKSNPGFGTTHSDDDDGMVSSFAKLKNPLSLHKFTCNGCFSLGFEWQKPNGISFKILSQLTQAIVI